MLFTAAAALAAGAVALAAVGARRADDRVPVLQLWMLPAGRGAVRIGVDAVHAKPAGYRLVLTGHGRRVWRVALGSTAHWQVTVRHPRGTQVVARLYRGATALRRVTARIP